MKKYLSIVIALLLVFSLFTGCTEKSTATENNGDSAAPTISQGVSATTAPTVTDAATDTIAQTEVYVFIAASLSNAMTEIADLYRQTQPNVKITFNADSSGALQTQIEEGAECDLFFSAATKQMTTLSDEGYVDAASIVDLLENKVVLIKPTGAKTKVTGFENIDEAKSLALAAESVPVGDYARQIFKNLGIWDKVQKMEINEGSNVTAVLSAVSEGSNEVGVVYETDAESVKDSVEIIATAPDNSLESPVIYPAGLVENKEADGVQKTAAKDFLTFLSSDTALAIFEKYGFTIHS